MPRTKTWEYLQAAERGPLRPTGPKARGLYERLARQGYLEQLPDGSFARTDRPYSSPGRRSETTFDFEAHRRRFAGGQHGGAW